MYLWGPSALTINHNILSAFPLCSVSQASLSGPSSSLSSDDNQPISDSLSLGDRPSSPSFLHEGPTSPISLGDRSSSSSFSDGLTSPLSLGDGLSPSSSLCDGQGSLLGDGLSPSSVVEDLLSPSSLSDVLSPLSLLSDRTPSESPSLDGDRPSSPLSSLGDSLLNGFQQSMDDTFETRELFEPLYQGADITVCGAYCCIMQFATTNKLTYTAISELIKLLHLICPPQNKLPSSFYKLKKFFNRFNVAFTHQKVCTKCSAPMTAGTSQCATCQDNDDLDPKAVGDLIHVPIEKALKTVVSSEFTQSSSKH